MARKRLEVEIAGDAGGAEAALAGTGAALDALSDKRIEIKAEDTDLRRKIVEDKELIHELGTEEGRARLNLSDEEAKAKIAELKADIDSIGLKRARLSIDDAEARARILALKGELDTLHDKDVKVDVDRDGSARNAVADLGKKFDETAGKIPTMVAAVGTLGPALIPAAAAATAGIGAMLVPLTAASIGFGALGIAAIPTIKGLEASMRGLKAPMDAFLTSTPGPDEVAKWNNLSNAIKFLPPELQPIATEGIGAARSLKDMSESVRPDLLAAATTSLHNVSTVLPQLAPAASEAALSLNDLGTSVGKGLQSPAWEHFLFVITPEIRPAIDSIGRSFGNLVKGLGGVVEAFAPFAGTVESGMERVTRAFANWGTGLGASAGFQHFMDYLRQNGPQLKTTVDDVAKAGESLVKAFAGFGGFNLKILDDLAKAITAIASAPGGAVALEITALALSAGKLASVLKLGTIIGDLFRLSGAIKAFQGAEGGIASIKAFFDYMGSGKAKIPTETPGTIERTGSAAKGAGNAAKEAVGPISALAGSAGLGGLAAIAPFAAVALPGVALGAWAIARGNAPAANATQTLNEKLREQVNAAGPAAQAGGNLANTLGNLQTTTHLSTQDLGALVDNLNRGGTALTDLSADGATANQQLVGDFQAVASGATGATPQVQAAARAWIAALQTVPPAAQPIGSQTGTSFGSGITSATGAVSSAAKGLGAAAEASAHADLSGAGANAGQSFASGVASAVGAAAAAGAAVANAAAAAAAAHQQSPDKRTMEIGANAGLGFALGIESQATRVAAAASRLLGAAYGGITPQAVSGGFAAGPSSYGGLTGQAARIVHIAEGAVQVSVGTEAQKGDVASAVNTAMGQLVRELRAT